MNSDMEPHSYKFRIRLGLFVLGGAVLFFLAIFIIGKHRNLFDPVYRLSTTFKNVSGLQVGNNVRFAGINVGTVDHIRILSDSTVLVDLLIRQDVRKFIKADCTVSMGSEGIIGDRLLVINQGSPEAPLAREGQFLSSVEPVERDAILNSLQVTAFNAEIITGQLAEIMVKINNGSGTLGRLLQDTTLSKNLDATISNLKRSSESFDENMNAAKDNILLRGYFRRQEREAEKLKAAEQAKSDTLNVNDTIIEKPERRRFWPFRRRQVDTTGTIDTIGN
jgi:phospholipid/cholesterol/gamma-HCH transport system substrate-binding protein